MLKLFFSPGSCALASHVALAETGADYLTVRVNFAAGEQRSAQYLAVNPKGRVPALLTPSGVLTETPAILVYLAQSWPDARLAPFDDAWSFAQAQSFASYLCSTVHVHHAHRTRPGRWADDVAAQEGMKRKVAQNMADAFTLIENDMLQGPWVAGKAYSFCDPYLFALACWLEGDGVDIARFPRVRDHHRRMLERPAVQRAMREEGLLPPSPAAT